MSNNARGDQGGMSAGTAKRLEFAIIGLGVLALLMIFQPFHITFFAIGAVLVVAAGLANNLLPLAQPGVPVRSVVKIAMVVALTFCIVLLVAIYAAYLYGLFFLRPPDPDTLSGKAQLNALPWYKHGFTWTIAAIAAILVSLITFMNRRKA